MGKDSKAEFLAQIARRKELMETSQKRMEHSTALIKQSRRLVRIAVGHGVDGEGNNQKTKAPIR